MHPCKEKQWLIIYPKFLRDVISFLLNINSAPFSRKPNNYFEKKLIVSKNILFIQQRYTPGVI